MLRRSSNILFIVVALSVLLAGCFSTGPKSPVGPKDPTPDVRTQVSGVILAPDGTPGGTVASTRTKLLAWLDPVVKAASAIGTVPVSGATVQALLLPDRRPIGPTAETDAKGQYTLTNLPLGASIIVVATKKVGDKQLRLSTYVESVAEQTKADADAATSLATEALAARVEEDKSYLVTQADWESAREKAQQTVEAIAKDDPAGLASLVVVGEGAIPENIGEGLGDDFDEISESLPDKPDPDKSDPIAEAKAMVQSLRDAGYSVKHTVETQLVNHEQSIEKEVVPFLTDFGYATGGISVKLSDAMELEPGLYRELHDADWCWDQSSEDDQDYWDCFYGAERRYDREGDVGDTGTWVLIGLDGDTYTITETLRADSGAYEVVVIDMYEIEKHNVSIDVVGVDSEGIPTSVRIVGTLSDDGFDATLAGRVDVGPRSDASGGLPETLMFDGSITSEKLDVNIESTVELQISLDGITPTTITAGGALEFPNFGLYGDVRIELIAWEETIYTGEGTYTMMQAFPKSFTVSGSLSDRDDSPTRFEGRLSVDLDIDDFDFMLPADESNFPQGTIEFSGSMQPAGYPWIGLGIHIWAEEYNKLTSHISYSRRDMDGLNGSASITLDPLFVELNLKNEVGIETTLKYSGDGDATGRIMKGAEKLADITVALGTVTVDYVDETSETLF